jgi:hypothetical protein
VSFGPRSRLFLSKAARQPPFVFVDKLLLEISKVALSAASMAAKKWVRFAKNSAAGSHRFCFGGFRRRTPGPPPFSSMNSTPICSSARQLCPHRLAIWGADCANRASSDGNGNCGI